MPVLIYLLNIRINQVVFFHCWSVIDNGLCFCPSFHILRMDKNVNVQSMCTWKCGRNVIVLTSDLDVDMIKVVHVFTHETLKCCVFISGLNCSVHTNKWFTWHPILNICEVLTCALTSACVGTLRVFTSSHNLKRSTVGCC